MRCLQKIDGRRVCARFGGGGVRALRGWRRSGAVRCVPRPVACAARSLPSAAWACVEGEVGETRPDFEVGVVALRRLGARDCASWVLACVGVPVAGGRGRDEAGVVGPGRGERPPLPLPLLLASRRAVVVPSP